MQGGPVGMGGFQFCRAERMLRPESSWQERGGKKPRNVVGALAIWVLFSDQACPKPSGICWEHTLHRLWGGPLNNQIGKEFES